MTDRTYTQKQVDLLLAAEREAVAREADAQIANRWEREAEFGAVEIANEIWECRQAILALIDQPSTLDALIGAAYLDAASACNNEHLEGDTSSESDMAYTNAVSDCIFAVHSRTPTDALAALDSVREAERERAVNDERKRITNALTGMFSSATGDAPKSVPLDLVFAAIFGEQT